LCCNPFLPFCKWTHLPVTKASSQLNGRPLRNWAAPIRTSSTHPPSITFPNHNETRRESTSLASRRSAPAPDGGMGTSGEDHCRLSRPRPQHPTRGFAQRASLSDRLPSSNESRPRLTLHTNGASSFHSFNSFLAGFAGFHRRRCVGISCLPCVAGGYTSQPPVIGRTAPRSQDAQQTQLACPRCQRHPAPISPTSDAETRHASRRAPAFTRPRVRNSPRSLTHIGVYPHHAI
jgi:hypothetical protein